MALIGIAFLCLVVINNFGYAEANSGKKDKDFASVSPQSSQPVPPGRSDPPTQGFIIDIWRRSKKNPSYLSSAERKRYCQENYAKKDTSKTTGYDLYSTILCAEPEVSGTVKPEKSRYKGQESNILAKNFSKGGTNQSRKMETFHIKIWHNKPDKDGEVTLSESDIKLSDNSSMILSKLSTPAPIWPYTRSPQINTTIRTVVTSTEGNYRYLRKRGRNVRVVHKKKLIRQCRKSFRKNCRYLKKYRGKKNRRRNRAWNRDNRHYGYRDIDNSTGNLRESFHSFYEMTTQRSFTPYVPWTTPTPPARQTLLSTVPAPVKVTTSKADAKYFAKLAHHPDVLEACCAAGIRARETKGQRLKFKRGCLKQAKRYDMFKGRALEEYHLCQRKWVERHSSSYHSRPFRRHDSSSHQSRSSRSRDLSPYQFRSFIERGSSPRFSSSSIDRDSSSQHFRSSRERISSRLSRPSTERVSAACNSGLTRDRTPPSRRSRIFRQRPSPSRRSRSSRRRSSSSRRSRLSRRRSSSSRSSRLSRRRSSSSRSSRLSRQHGSSSNPLGCPENDPEIFLI